MMSVQRQLWRNLNHLRSFTTSPIILSKKDTSDGKEETKLSQEDVTNKLNDLLNKMIQEDDGTPKTTVKLAQAVKRKKQKTEKEKPLGKQLEEAAKDVATSLGGDIEETESELLKVLLRRSEPSTQVLKDVLANIKVDKSEAPVSRAQQVRASLDRHKPNAGYDIMKTDMRKPRKKTEPSAYVDILGAEPSSYFKDLKPQPSDCELQTWTSCVERDMRLATTHPPTSIYEQMILWTNNGMLWHFPIDNFQGLEEEKQVPFEEHIFLDQHLEGWCPERGPVRQFMELVCVGLSKNYWLTVEEKKMHIMWFRDYFADKKALIQELGAGKIEIEGDQKKDLFATVIHRPQT